MVLSLLVALLKDWPASISLWIILILITGSGEGDKKCGRFFKNTGRKIYLHVFGLDSIAKGIERE